MIGNERFADIYKMEFSDDVIHEIWGKVLSRSDININYRYERFTSSVGKSNEEIE
mgnify:CR=1 FL=1